MGSATRQDGVRPAILAASLLLAAMGPGGAIELQQQPAPSAAAASAPAISGRPTGFSFQGGGSVAGYDAQIGALVLGIEGDVGASSSPGAGDGSLWDGQTYRSQFGGGFSAVRGRAGHALGGILLYGTGGLALDEHGLEAGAGSVRAGWVAGGGAEAAITAGLSGRIEFLRLDFSSFRDVGGGSEPYRNAVDMLRVGFNYRF